MVVVVRDSIRSEGVPIGEAAARLGVTTETLRKRVQRGQVRAFKRGKHWYVVLDRSAPVQDNTNSVPDPVPDLVQDRTAAELAHVRALLEEVQHQRDTLVQEREALLARLADAHQLLQSDAVERAELRRLLAQALQMQAAQALAGPEPHVAVDSAVTSRRPWWWRLIFRERPT